MRSACASFACAGTRPGVCRGKSRRVPVSGMSQYIVRHAAHDAQAAPSRVPLARSWRARAASLPVSPMRALFLWLPRVIGEVAEIWNGARWGGRLPGCRRAEEQGREDSSVCCTGAAAARAWGWGGAAEHRQKAAKLLLRGAFWGPGGARLPAFGSIP